MDFVNHTKQKNATIGKQKRPPEHTYQRASYEAFAKLGKIALKYGRDLSRPRQLTETQYLLRGRGMPRPYIWAEK